MNSSMCEGFAKALFSLTKKEDLLNVNLALDEVKKQMDENKDFSLFLLSYEVSTLQKQKVLNNVFSLFNLPHFVSFLSVLASYHGFDTFEKVIDDFHSLSDLELGIKRGIVYTRFHLSKSDLEKIEAAFEMKEKKTIKLKNIIDFNVIGGLKVSLDGEVYDYTIANRLNKLRASLIQGGNSNED
ncbi:MAG TPA: ATP synthase F1 subunit delta [Firmicutes bacterium]|nr:ATP synthase F1 subunit delta [Bacillota bacterium]HBX24705.1 ATP synthase F1 subunit delta [Bacillota bacterium]